MKRTICNYQSCKQQTIKKHFLRHSLYLTSENFFAGLMREPSHIFVVAQQEIELLVNSMA